MLRAHFLLKSISDRMNLPIRCCSAVAVLAILGAEPIAAQQNRTPLQFVQIPDCRVKFARSVSLASQQAGILDSVLDPGQTIIAKGDVARLRDDVLQASRAIAAKDAANDIEIRFANKTAELAQLRHERAMAANISEPGTVSEIELRSMRLDAEKAQLQLEQAEHAREVARLKLAEIDANLATYHLRAPFHAFVRKTLKQPGEVVQQGEVVAEVVDTSQVRISGFASLEAARHLQTGMPVQLKLGGENAVQIPAKISFVDVKVEPVSKRIEFSAIAENGNGRLREGLQVTLLVPVQPTRTSTQSGMRK